jgi:hypothetical protein
VDAQIPMSRKPKADQARIRIALAKGQELARRSKDLETCLSVEHKVALSAALADDYAALLEEYPDVFPAPPKSPEQVRAGASELRKAQAEAEAAAAESEATSRALRAKMSELTRPRHKPDRPS